MKKKNIINKLIVAPLVMGFMSCTGNYMDINSNPYQPGDLTPDDYALGSAMSNLASTVISSDVNTAQFTDCLLGGPLGGYFADSNAGWSNTISNFNATNDWTRVFLISDRIISTLYGNLSTVKQVSENTNNPVPYAIAQIIKVAAMSRVTDAYGPIPYSKIGQDGKITIPYDTQEEVYNAFFKELDESIEVLTENRNAALVASADFVYSGNVQKWVKFANSLKLRLAIRIANVSPAKAKEMAESAVNHELGLIETNADNATWKYFGTISNPLFVAVRYNEEASGGDTHPAADIICYMNGYEDPRREKYFSKAQFSGDNALEYVGMRRGIAIPALSTVGLLYSGVNFVDGMATPLQWMNAAEVAFLKAEAVGVFGWNMGGSAKTFYEQGVRLSFEQWGVAGVDEYLVGTTLPESYTDPNGGATSYSTQLSQLGVAWNDGASKEEMQERIIIQKWIANFHLGNEAWADFRRTGFPHLIPAMGNNSQGIRNLTLGARRMSYPADEATNNPENYAKAVEMLGGSDNMATRMWWDCNPAVK